MLTAGGVIHSSPRRLHQACLAACLLMLCGGLLAEGPLFDDDAVLEVSIPVDFKSLCRPREDPSCDFTQTTLEYSDEQGAGGRIPVGIKIRGGWRSLARNCSAPLLWIRFEEQDVEGTPFAGQSLLPLTTHCGRGLSLDYSSSRLNRSTWEQYLLREYLGHRLFGLLTDMSIRVRLVVIHYLNPERPGRTVRNYAFFSEHFDSVAERNGARRLDRGSFDHEKLDTAAADLLALFQYMIGNTDWSIVRERNTVLMETSDGLQVPVPYDLDMSGLVNAHYAGPAPGLPIEDVRERYYLGFCHPDLDWPALFGHFQQQQHALLSLIDAIPQLDRSSRKTSEKFLARFFTELDSEELRTARIIDACQPWPPPTEDHTTPTEGR
ncbi:MAG: hypothetical protein HKP03_09270 [Xanthomonadales bacterium]|nr:hypothetical protein [Xanthomonadales bacterium]